MHASVQPVVVTMQPMPTVVVSMFGSQPMNLTCPFCNAVVQTGTQSRASCITWMFCLIIFFLGGFLGCCLIPLYVEDCQRVTHTCPSCGTTLGTNGC